MQRMGILFNSQPQRNYGPLHEVAHLKIVCCMADQPLENNQMSCNFVKNVTFGFPSDGHVDVKASLTKSGEVI